jgi:hypothetical protein
MNLTDEIIFRQPQSEDERAAVAEACVLHLNFEMPMLLDDIGNQVDTKYMALPERLYVVDADGVITYRSELGPWGFDMAAWTSAIEAVMAA